MTHPPIIETVLRISAELKDSGTLTDATRAHIDATVKASSAADIDALHAFIREHRGTVKKTVEVGNVIGIDISSAQLQIAGVTLLTYFGQRAYAALQDIFSWEMAPILVQQTVKAVARTQTDWGGTFLMQLAQGDSTAAQYAKSYLTSDPAFAAKLTDGLDARWRAGSPTERAALLNEIGRTPSDAHLPLMLDWLERGDADIPLISLLTGYNWGYRFKTKPALHARIWAYLSQQVDKNPLRTFEILLNMANLAMTPAQFQPIVARFTAYLQDERQPLMMRKTRAVELSGLLNIYGHFFDAASYSACMALIEEAITWETGAFPKFQQSVIDHIREENRLRAQTCSVCGAGNNNGVKIIACLKCKKVVCQTHSTNGFSASSGSFCSRDCAIKYHGNSNPMYW